MTSKSTGTEKATAPNTHCAWLKELRSLSVRLGGGLDDDRPGTVPSLRERIRDLQDQIADTTATSKDDIMAQLSLFSDLAWSDLARRLSSNLSKGIKQLWHE